ncbi:AraC family transcriptional regulator [Vitiosangium sp. GDMCC 1.1324]|nr:AraC family transcriptional regulator [Vitiosangium sp. GDMCC 1.1324]
MTRQEQAVAVRSPLETDAPSVVRRGARPRIGLGVDLLTMPAGEVELPPLPDHRLSVHAGAPVWSSCRSSPSRRYRYTRGDVDIMPAGASAVVLEEEETTSLVVRLPHSLLRLAAEEMGLDPDRAGLEARHQFKDPQIEHVAWALEAERRAGHPNGLLYTESLGMALAVHLLGRYAVPLESRQGLPKRQLQRVTDYIEEHLDQNLSLDRLARVAGVSTSHLKTQFKRSMGVPVHEYVIQRRVERAKALLQRGGLSVGEVALRAGFSHQSHLARCMRRVLGVTPTSVMRGSRAP